MSEKAFRNALEKRIEKFGGQAAYARHLGVSRVVVNKVVLGHKLPTVTILNDLGFELIKTVKHEYRRKK